MSVSVVVSMLANCRYKDRASVAVVGPISELTLDRV